MSERRQRSTWYLSRETVQLMLQMKNLLRQYGVMISLTDPDVHDLLIQAAEAIDDEEMNFLRLRLMAATQPTNGPATEPMTSDEEDPFIDDVEERPAANSIVTKPPIASHHSKPPVRDKSIEAFKTRPDAIRNVYFQGPFIEEATEVFLESEEESVPETKRVALNRVCRGIAVE